MGGRATRTLSRWQCGLGDAWRSSGLAHARLDCSLVLALCWACCLPSAGAAPLVTGAAPMEVLPVQGALRFPQDEGAHPDWKTEWWYVTGWLEDGSGPPRGFQVTFFRNRGPADATHVSAFAPRQILLAHAALSDPRRGSILHAERVARSGFGLAEFRTGDTGVHIDDWSLERSDGGALLATVQTADFALRLRFLPTQPVMLEGQHGRSQKGHDARAFSWYYSLPHLAVSGTLSARGQAAASVHGSAWLDHEWSNAYVGDHAVGWDWTGLNFTDGSALMAFRMRNAQGETVWSSGTWRDAHGQVLTLGNGALQFVPGRNWTSAATGARYPVEWTLRWADQEVALSPLMDNQEMDTRMSTGTAYWEGAVTAVRRGAPVARGYLELTGYWKPLQF